mgnify:CR=1 FL=1
MRAQAQLHEPFSWWEANVLRIRGDFIQVHYLGWENGKDEFVELEVVRPAYGRAGVPGSRAPPASAPACSKGEYALTDKMHTWLLSHGGGLAILSNVVTRAGAQPRIPFPTTVSQPARHAFARSLVSLRVRGPRPASPTPTPASWRPCRTRVR